MARGINKVIIVGNCGQDPETRYLPSGGAVTNISIATSESWKDKNTGEQQERTEWHRVVFFNRLGEIAGEYLKKGSKVYVEGSLRTRKWQGQDGQIATQRKLLPARCRCSTAVVARMPVATSSRHRVRILRLSKIRLLSRLSKRPRKWAALTTIFHSRFLIQMTAVIGIWLFTKLRLL